MIFEMKFVFNLFVDVLSVVYFFKKNCLFCNVDYNFIECFSFVKVFFIDCQEFVMKQRLCFLCLGGGYQFRSCYKRKFCIYCNKRYVIVMYVSVLEVIVVFDCGKDGFQSENNQFSIEKNRVDYFCGLIIMEDFVIVLFIVVVKVKVKGSFWFVEIYVLLDNGFNIIFCLVSLMKCLSVSGKEMRIKLIIMDSCNDVDSFVVMNLEVIDLDENVVIFLLEVFF